MTATVTPPPKDDVHTHGRQCIYVQLVNFNKNFSETNNFRDLISLNTDYYL